MTAPTSGAAHLTPDGDRPEGVSAPGSNLSSELRPLARALIELALQLAEEEPENEEKTA